ncbi:PHD and RING finger domain-containing protein 1-like [Neocloeon triangulifer]|uniref:PHD and RING finger domain-containing protein 1-like n=1 Tax=Neocloeon triangulifer TaxID=2078957 RepID=UPI00286F4282|nr:PHD and RING finger domain-containing protein 1-like [Neocloeon triangulifer]XP_059490715.1 PHD and RING finger domain-containing protein 1-like [Neocloeon triangulifer]
MADETVGISPAQAASTVKGFTSIDWADNEECPICRKLLGTKSVGVPDCCSHFFCYTCIKSWVTKSKSNCPMDRMDIAELKVFDSQGKFQRTEKVKPKEQEDEIDFEFDDDGICPDCGWMGMRATVGVCLHCMYHVENPFPVRNCPQCMEDESNQSDDEWVPEANRDPQSSSRRRSLRSDNNQHVLLDDNDWSAESRERASRNRRRINRDLEDFVVNEEIEEDSNCSINSQILSKLGEKDHSSESSDSEVDEDEEVDEDFDPAQPGPSTSRAVARPVRKKVVRKTAAKTKRKTTTKRKRKTRKRKVTKRKTTAGGKTRRKRKVKKRRTTKKKKRVTNRPTLPEDSAKKRLAKILGVRPPKFNGQMLPRGCKKRPVTAAQRQAMAASSSASNVYNRPLGSLEYHHHPTPTLHLFGGEELEYFPSDSDSEGSSSSYHMPKKPLPSTSASVIKRYKSNALKSLRKKAVAASAISSQPTCNLLDSILESQTKKFEIKSGITERLDPYKKTSLPSTSFQERRKIRFSCDEPSTSQSTETSLPIRKKIVFTLEEGGQKVIVECKKSPTREDDLDLYGDIPSAGGGDAGGDDGDEDDYLFEGGGGGSSNNGDGGNGNDDEEDDNKEIIDDKEEEDDEKEDDDDEEAEEIDEMVIDESIIAQEEIKEEEEETEIKDPLEIAEPEELPDPPEPAPVVVKAEELVVPEIVPETIFPVETPPVFKYSYTSLQIARHLHVDDEVPQVENEEPPEQEDFPEEPESDQEVKSENCVDDPAPERSSETPSPQLPGSSQSTRVASLRLSPPTSSSTKTRINPPEMTNGVVSTRTENDKKPSGVKSRKKSLVEELFGFDTEEKSPPKKVVAEKVRDDGEIKEKKKNGAEKEDAQPVKKELREEREATSPPRKEKRKKEKVKESSKKKKKDRKRSRSRSSSSDRRKKHHSRKSSPPRRSRKRSRSRSRSRKRHDENGRVPVHERLGPRRGRSRDRSEEAGKKEVFSSGENILVSVNFSRRRKRIAEIAAKRRPVAVINLAVDDDKSPVVEKGDSPKELIELDEGWSTDEEVKKPKHKESQSKSKDKSSKNKDSGPKTPPEPQVKFSIASRPQLKHKNVLGAHDDDDDEPEQSSSELKDSNTSKNSVAESYDPFNPTASPMQEAENEPPAAVQAPSQALPLIEPQLRPISPPKLLTEMPKIERPPPAIPVTTAKPVTEIFPGLPANVANILCSSQLQNVFTPQLSALAVPLLLSAPCFMNMQNVVQQANQPSTASAPAQPKVDNGVVDMELESPYSPAASEGDDLFEPPAGKSQTPTKTANKPQEKFDSLFGIKSRGNNKVNKSSSKPSSSKTPVKEVKTSVVTSTGKKDISIKMDRNNLKVVGDLPTTAIETQVKEKFLKKLNRQERVVEEVKVALKPHYTKKLINKEEYKDILRRAVPKVCHNKSGEINPAKIKGLVSEYVKRVRHERKKVKKQ